MSDQENANDPLQDHIDNLGLLHSPMCLKIEHDNNSSIPDDCSCGVEQRVKDFVHHRERVVARKAELTALLVAIKGYDALNEALAELNKEEHE